MKVTIDKNLIERQRKHFVSVEEWTQDEIDTLHQHYEEILENILDTVLGEYDPAVAIRKSDFGYEFGDRNDFHIIVDEEGIYTRNEQYQWAELDECNTIEVS